MHRIAHRAVACFTSIAVAAIVAACSVDHAPSAPSASELAPTRSADLDLTPLTNGRQGEQVHRLAATLRRVTARYHDIDAATHDHFVLLHGCETRLGDEPVGTVYVNLDRLTDGVINPELPDALIYEPSEKGLKLVGVEFAVPFTLWPQPEPPQLLGTTFQREDEFGVFALHAWVWRRNPNGIFAETNPRVTCSGT